MDMDNGHLKMDVSWFLQILCLANWVVQGAMGNPTDLFFGLFVILDLNVGPSAADLYDTTATQSSVQTWKRLTTWAALLKLSILEPKSKLGRYFERFSFQKHGSVQTWKTLTTWDAVWKSCTWDKIQVESIAILWRQICKLEQNIWERWYPPSGLVFRRCSQASQSWGHLSKLDLSRFHFE